MQVRQDDDPLGRTLRTIADEIRGQPREIGYVVDHDGTVLVRAEGTPDRVDVPADLARGRIVIHNHPDGSSLSRNDVQELLRVQAAEIRVVGRRFDYRLLLPPDTEWDDVESLVQDIFREVLRDLTAQFYLGQIDSETVVLEHMHLVWHEVADIKGWTYTRTERPP